MDLETKLVSGWKEKLFLLELLERDKGAKSSYPTNPDKESTAS